MKDSHRIIVESRKVKYDFTVKGISLYLQATVVPAKLF